MAADVESIAVSYMHGWGDASLVGPIGKSVVGDVIGIEGNAYCEAAHAIGSPSWRTLLRHVWPNIAIGWAIVAGASLSFPGFGLPPEVSGWGGMLSREGRQYMTIAPWLAIWPWSVPDHCGVRITAPDKYTVVIRFNTPTFFALDNLYFDSPESGSMYPPEVIKEHGNAQDWTTLVGTGPLMMTDWVEGSNISYVKNPDYWKDDEKYPGNILPYVDEYKLLFIKERATLLSALRTGQIAYMRDLSEQEFEDLQRTNPDLKVKTGFQFRSTTSYTSASSGNLDWTQAAKDYWAQIGVDVEIDIQEIAVFISNINGRTWEGMSWGEYAANSNGLYYARTHGHSTGNWNFSAAAYPEIDALIEAAESAAILEEMQRLVREWDMYTIENHWGVYGGVGPAWVVWQPWLGGYNGELQLGAAAHYAIPTRIFPAVWWGWSPSMVLIRFTEDPLGNLGMFLVPAAILGMVLSGTTMRMTRTMALEVLRQDYIRTAWSKGLEEKVVVMRHVLKNALIPVVTIVGFQLPILIGGSVILEQIFVLPGIGTLLLDAIQKRDCPIVSGINLFIATAVVLINLVVDLTYAYLDPRVRYR